MHFDFSDKTKDYIARVSAFMDEHIYPNLETYKRQHAEFDNPWNVPPIVEELKEKVKGSYTRLSDNDFLFLD